MNPRALVAIVLASGLIAGVASTAEAARSPQRCAARASKTLYASNLVRLYTTTNRDGDRQYVACRKSTGGRKVMGEENTFSIEERGVSGFRVRGLYVALGLYYSGPDYVEEDLVWGKAGAAGGTRTVSAYTGFADPNPSGSGSIGAWLLSRSGNVAFIAFYHEKSQVVLGSVNGAPKVLDESEGENGIGTGSLALSVDDTLYWRNGGEAGSALVPAPSR